MTKVHSHEDSVSYMAVPGLARSLCELGKEADAIALVIDSSQQSTMMRARIMAAARQPDCEVLALLAEAADEAKGPWKPPPGAPLARGEPPDIPDVLDNRMPELSELLGRMNIPPALRIARVQFYL